MRARHQIKIIPLLMIDLLESMNPTDLDKRSDMTGVRCEMSTVDQRDDEWQVWFLIGAAVPNGGFYVITDKPSKKRLQSLTASP